MSSGLSIAVTKFPGGCKLHKQPSRVGQRIVPLNPKHFAGFRALLADAAVPELGLSADGKTTLPQGASIVGLSLPENSGLAVAGWDLLPGPKYHFVMTPEGKMLIFHLALPVETAINFETGKIACLGVGNLTELIEAARHFEDAAAAEMTIPIDGTQIRVSVPKDVREVLRNYCPGLDFLHAKTELEREDLVESEIGATTVQTPIQMSAGTVLQLPPETRGLKVTLPGYAAETFIFLAIGSESVVCARTSLEDNGRPPLYDMMHLRMITDAAKALKVA